MRIEGNSPRVGAGSNTERIATQSAENGNDSPRAESARERTTDQAVLTPRAQDVRTALGALSRTPEVRAEKVEEIKAQIEAGTFRVDAGAIADKLLEGGL